MKDALQVNRVKTVFLGGKQSILVVLVSGLEMRHNSRYIGEYYGKAVTS